MANVIWIEINLKQAETIKKLISADISCQYWLKIKYILKMKNIHRKYK